jgi:hypothetical protein
MTVRLTACGRLPTGPAELAAGLRYTARQCEEQMIVLSDTAFHAAEGDPANLKLLSLSRFTVYGMLCLH